MVDVKKTEDRFTISAARARARPSAEIGVVDIKKLRTFYDFGGARDPLRRSAWSMFKHGGFFTMFSLCARPSAEIGVVAVLKLRTFDMPERPSAQIGVVEALSLSPWECAKCPVNPLRGSCVSKRARGAVRICFARSRVRSPPGPRQLF